MNYFCGCYVCQMWVQCHYPHSNFSHQPSSYFNQATFDSPPLNFNLSDHHDYEPKLKQILNDQQLPHIEVHQIKFPKQPLENIQRQGRNISSNIFRSFHRYCQTYIGGVRFCQLKSKLNWKCTINDILYLFAKQDINSRSYIKLKTIKKMIVQESPEIGQALTFFLKDYLKTSSRNHFLTSKKIKKENKKLILKGIRNLQQKIESMWFSEICQTQQQNQNLL